MRLGAVLLGCLLVTTAFAGCLGGGSGDDVDSSSAEDPAVEDNETTATAERTATNETSEANDTPEDTGPVIETKTITGTVRGFKTPVGIYICTPLGSCDNSFEFEVGANQTDVLVEATWNQSVAADMDVDVPSDKCEAESGEDCPPELASGESPLRIEATSPDFEDKSGTWNGFIFPGTTTPSEIQYTIYVTLVSEGELPSGYTNVDR